MQPKLFEATKRKLAALRWEAEKEDCLKDIYQFLFEADSGMYGDGEEPDGHETLVGDARVLRDKMEYYFASEITVDEDPSADYGDTTHSEKMQDNLEPIE